MILVRRGYCLASSGSCASPTARYCFAVTKTSVRARAAKSTDGAPADRPERPRFGVRYGDSRRRESGAIVQRRLGLLLRSSRPISTRPFSPPLASASSPRLPCVTGLRYGAAMDEMANRAPRRARWGPSVSSTAILVALLVRLGPPSALAAAPQERVRQTLDAVSAVLNDPELQGSAKERDRRERVGKVMRDSFDFRAIGAGVARISLSYDELTKRIRTKLAEEQ